MSEELTGKITAPNRAGLTATARARAAQWFGQDTCLSISVGDVIDITEDNPRYLAAYTARVSHRWSRVGTFGFPTCSGCKATDYGR